MGRTEKEGRGNKYQRASDCQDRNRPSQNHDFVLCLSP
jgi:hypothetical protein